MGVDAIEIEVAGHAMVARGDRTLWWGEEKILFLADPHFGKSDSMRRMGAALPGGTTTEMLGRLDRALSATGAEHLVILGDLLHDRAGRQKRMKDEVAAWRRNHEQLALTLIIGNHDRAAGSPPKEWQIDVQSDPFPYKDSGLLLRHEPEAHSDGYVIAGHLHPGFTLRETTGEAMRLPCFAFGPDRAILPAFSLFTGTAPVRRRQENQIILVADGELVLLP